MCKVSQDVSFSFHVNIRLPGGIAPSSDFCFIRRSGVPLAVLKKAEAARTSIFSSDALLGQEQNDDDNGGDTEENNNLGDEDKVHSGRVD